MPYFRRTYCTWRQTSIANSFELLREISALLTWTMLRISYVLLHIFTWGELSAQRVEELCPAQYTQTSQVPWANLLEPNRDNFAHFGDLYTLPDYSFVNSSKLKVTTMATSCGTAVWCRRPWSTLVQLMARYQPADSLSNRQLATDLSKLWMKTQ